MSKYLWISILLALVLLTASCGKKKRLVASAIPEMDLEVEELISKTKSQLINFDSMTARVGASVDVDGSSRSFNASLRARKDSVMLISATAALGVEAARFLFKTDSAGFVDRINKKYFYGDYTYLSRVLKTNIDYQFVQDIILGDLVRYSPTAFYQLERDSLFFYLTKMPRTEIFDLIGLSDVEYKTASAKEMFESRIANHSLVKKLSMYPEKERSLMIYHINGDFKVEKIIYGDIAQKRYFEINYADFDKPEETENQLQMPHKIQFYAVEKDKEVSVELAVSRVRLNRPIGISFNIPDRFEEIEINFIKGD
jgi:hypothetical protein